VPYIVLCCLATVGCVISAALFLRGRRNASFAALVATVWVGWFWGWSKMAPVVGAQRGDISFATQLRALVDAEPDYRERMFQVAQQNPTIIWHSDVRYPRVLNQLETLNDQKGERDYEVEVRKIAEEMIRKLSSDELALLVATRAHYLQFKNQGPAFARELGLEMPETHLWIQSEAGPPRHQTILFGNQPPPFEEPALEPPPPEQESRRSRATSRRATPGDEPGGTVLR